MDPAHQSSSGASLDPCKARRVPGIRGKKTGLLDLQGFVMMYIKTDGAKKFFKRQECAEGCEVSVYLEWKRRPPWGAQWQAAQPWLQDALEWGEEDGWRCDGRGCHKLTLQPRAVYQSFVAKMMEKHRNQFALSLLPTYKASQQRESLCSTRDLGHPGWLAILHCWSNYPRLIWTCAGLLIIIWDCQLLIWWQCIWDLSLHEVCSVLDHHEQGGEECHSSCLLSSPK